MNKLDEQVLLQEICKRLDASIARLPHTVEQQLHASRQAALLQVASQPSQEEAGLAHALRRELDENGALPANIEARLDQIRHRAVTKYEQQRDRTATPGGFSLGAWMKNRVDSFNFAAGTGMLATACVLVTSIAIFYVNSRPTGSLTLEEEISLVATAEDIELYENLEFYLWLAENESLTL